MDAYYRDRGERMSIEQRRITLIENDDGWWTAHDEARGLTAQDETREGALDRLDAVVEAAEGHGGRKPTDEELRAWGIDPDDDRRRRVDGGDLPEVLR